jgi:hypothetical protein
MHGEGVWQLWIVDMPLHVTGVAARLAPQLNEVSAEYKQDFSVLSGILDRH